MADQPDSLEQRYRYERPNQKWVCGNSREGQPCRIGPDALGRCRATSECQPRFEKKEGETKGRYHCMRPKEYGGPCGEGPLPDGQCSRIIPKCQPIPTLRSRRGGLSFAVVTATVALLLIVLNGPSRLAFINPGPISSAHSGEKFLKALGPRARDQCSQCHQNAHLSTAALLNSAFRGDYDFSGIAKMATPGPPAMHRLDNACLRCHADKNFHHKNVIERHSCSVCHREHRGAMLTRDPGDVACARCHDDQPSMERGQTPAFASFSEDHPEFWMHAKHAKETSGLRFDHARHFAADIPFVNGDRLACASCHQSTASGIAFLRVSFDSHCKACHSLQFDKRNPSLQIPHGDAAAVRAYLRSLPVQYGDYGRREKAIIQQRQLDEFVAEQITALRSEFQTEDNLESSVFFGAQPDHPRRGFTACTLCHEVRPSAVGGPAVAAVSFTPQWLPRSQFNHAKHRSLECNDCHDAANSHESSDILMPEIDTCRRCHSSAGGYADNCTFCHAFHRTPQ